MLQIKNISKKYKTGDLVQIALNDVSLNLRDNEFVSILGPSGSGKTTLLNIIGGLDRYDSGDLIINSVSTKNYKDRDWDSYRNHTIGFVFQSYNLIPHQSVLANVELALTIGGISKKERRQRALDALAEVGLKEQAHKKPNQMSGGQMQRVAIARALVNNPDILLADEPTGALDTETSIQVMDLLRKVANDRLVVMVTHNPELAEAYSSRIVRLKDGKIIDDSDPFLLEETVEMPVHRNMGKSSMSLFTAFSLSFNNLLTKKGRTLLTSFAGSIGIIGIALILSLSTGFQNYIDQIQEDTLTSYPLSITSDTADVTSVLLSMVSDEGDDNTANVVKEQQMVSSMFSKVGTNDLKSLKNYLKENQQQVNDMVSVIQYDYDVQPLVYTENEKGITQINPNTLLSALGGDSLMSTMSSVTTSIFNEMLDDPEALAQQYDVLAGRWPNQYNEVILVLSDPSAISDLLVYSLGLRDSAELEEMLSKVIANEKYESNNEPMEFTYDDLMKLPLKLVDASATYQYNEKYDIYENMAKDQDFMRKVYDEAEELKIVGIVCAKEGSTSMTLRTGVAYTKELTEYVIDKASESEIVQKQLADKEVNVFSGKRFNDESEESGLKFEDMISIDENQLANAFGAKVSQEDIANITQGYMSRISQAVNADTSKAEEQVNEMFMFLANDLCKIYIEEHLQEIVLSDYIDLNNVEKLVAEALLKLQQQYPQLQIDEEALRVIMNRMKDELSKINTEEPVKGALLKKQDIGTLVKAYMQTIAAKEKTAELSKEYSLPQEVFEQIYTPLLISFLESMPSNDSEQIVMLPNMLESQIGAYMSVLALSDATSEIATMMCETVMQKTIMGEVGKLSGELIQTMAQSFNVDPESIAAAFKFDMSEDELRRLMQTMTASGVEKNANLNLISLGYQDLDAPSAISFYFKDFESKEDFLKFLDAYNEKMENEDDEKVIKYTDITGILMSSVKTIVDSVSYVLIAFVSISLIVSSIMIGIITYISVLERTKEIGVLRAIGASKRNISSIFNAETFIIGLCSGLIGIGITLLLNLPINQVIHSLTGNASINATLPITGGTILIILSVILTLIGGIIPSRKAAKQDPVAALRSE